MKIILMIVAMVAISGCVENDATTKRRGDARLAVFKECMELAAKMPRQADDDVSDIVADCSNESYYMTNYLK